MPLLLRDTPGFAQITRAAGRAAVGAVKLVKSTAGIDLADDATIAGRRSVCASCPEKIMDKLGIERCGPLWRSLAGTGKTCGCAIASKTKLKDESCPMNRW